MFKPSNLNRELEAEERERRKIEALRAQRAAIVKRIVASELKPVNLDEIADQIAEKERRRAEERAREIAEDERLRESDIAACELERLCKIEQGNYRLAHLENLKLQAQTRVDPLETRPAYAAAKLFETAGPSVSGAQTFGKDEELINSRKLANQKAIFEASDILSRERLERKKKEQELELEFARRQAESLARADELERKNQLLRLERQREATEMNLRLIAEKEARQRAELEEMSTYRQESLANFTGSKCTDDVDRIGASGLKVSKHYLTARPVIDQNLVRDNAIIREEKKNEFERIRREKELYAEEEKQRARAIALAERRTAAELKERQALLTATLAEQAAHANSRRQLEKSELRGPIVSDAFFDGFQKSLV